MSRTVRVGSREYAIEPFNGRKAILAGRMVGRLAKKVPGLLETDIEFQRAYAAANAIRITRAMALSTWKGRVPEITDAQWEQLGGELVIPQPPGFEVRLANVLMEAFETAEEDVLKLLALAVIPNGDLADAARGGDPRQALLEKAEELLDGGTLAQLIDLAAAVADQVKDEFESGGGGLGKLRALWAGQGATDEQPEPQPEPAPEPTAPQPSTPTPTPPATSKEPTSSTDSPPSTDGDTTESSTAPRGGSLSPSATA